MSAGGRPPWLRMLKSRMSTGLTGASRMSTNTSIVMPMNVTKVMSRRRVSQRPMRVLSDGVGWDGGGTGGARIGRWRRG